MIVTVGSLVDALSDPAPRPVAGAEGAQEPQEAPVEGSGAQRAAEGDSEPRAYAEVWDDSVAPGGMVCAECGMPVESEPCTEHAPAEEDES